MRRIVMFNRTAADGAFAVADGNLNWAVPDEELERGATEGMLHADAILLGRRTYDAFESFWPHALDDGTGADPHAPGRHNPALRRMAEWINGAAKHVISRTKKKVTWQNSHIVSEFDPRKIAALKGSPGKDIMIFGSGSIVSLLTEHRLIDEYQFVVTPVLLAGGKPLLSGVSKDVKLELLESKKTAAGNVLLRYGLAR